MDLTTDVKALKGALAAIKPAVQARHTNALPVLCGAHLVAGPAGLKLTATNLDMTISTSVDAVVRQVGIAVVPHKLLAEAVGKSKGNIDLVAIDDDTFAANNGIGNKMRPLKAEDYPKLPSRPDGTRLPVDMAALAAVLPAAGIEDSRPILTGILFGGGADRNEIVATDSYRLHIVTTGVYPRHLIPGRAIATLLKAAKRTGKQGGWFPATVTFGEHDAWFETNGVTIVTRVIEGEFPNYRQLIPTSQPVELRVIKEQFRSAVAGVKTMVRDSTTPVRLKMESGKLTLRVTNQELGESVAEIPASLAGPDMTTAFNPAFLLDASDVPGDIVTLKLTDALKPGMIEVTDDDGRLHRRLLMPVRVPQ